MRAIEKLRGRRGVLLDTMVFIHFFEDSPPHAETSERLLRQMAEGSFAGVVTPITAAELLVKPLRQKRMDLADRYRNALGSLTNLTHVPLSPDVGYMAGALRAAYGLPLPDMLQVAAAMLYPKPAIVTNDKALRRVAEVEVFLLDELTG